METKNVYQMVTDRIVKNLEKGVIPWQKPWCGNGSAAINYVTRQEYSPLNQWLLGRPGEWLTWSQIHKLGGSVKKGAESSIIVFYCAQTSRKETRVNEQGEEETVNVIKKYDFPVLKYYRVFHIDDCNGIESKLDVTTRNNNPIESAESIIDGYLKREEGLQFINTLMTDEAYYSPSKDLVQVPCLSQYDVVEEYYSTAFHELVHSTMKEGRCNRRSEGTNARFGSEEYSREELVAEIGSAMLCQIAGLDCEKAFNNSVAYLKSWLKALKNDNKMIIWAASRAEKAAKYIQG